MSFIFPFHCPWAELSSRVLTRSGASRPLSCPQASGQSSQETLAGAGLCGTGAGWAGEGELALHRGHPARPACRGSQPQRPSSHLPRQPRRTGRSPGCLIWCMASLSASVSSGIPGGRAGSGRQQLALLPCAVLALPRTGGSGRTRGSPFREPFSLVMGAGGPSGWPIVSGSCFRFS